MSRRPDDRSRVLVLIKGLGVGGAEKLISEAAPLWNRDEFDYSVAYILPWKDQLVQPLRETGIDVLCVGGETGLDVRTRNRFRKLVGEKRPDLIHAHLPAAGILARLSTRTPVVYTEHNLAHSYRQPTRTLNRLSYGLNRSVICVSEAVRDSLAGFPGPEPILIPNGVTSPEVERPESARTELGIEATTPLVVHVGNIRPHKGHSNLIAATRLLVAEIPEVQVVSIGGEKYPGDLERVIGEAEEHGVGDSIRFLGRREDALTFVAAANAFVNPSDAEGLPVAILEAMALGTPVVATDVGGVSSVVVDESTGLLVPPDDPRRLADAMARTLTNGEAATWSSRASELVEERHGLGHMVEQYENVYRGILRV